MMIILIYRTNFIIGVITIITVKIRSPKSPDVVEVGDSSTDLFVVPRGCLWLVLDHVVLHVAEKRLWWEWRLCWKRWWWWWWWWLVPRNIAVIVPGESHWSRLNIGDSNVGRGLWTSESTAMSGGHTFRFMLWALGGFTWVSALGWSFSHCKVLLLQFVTPPSKQGVLNSLTERRECFKVSNCSLPTCLSHTILHSEHNGVGKVAGV